MVDFTMPSLGADMEAGTLVEWLKEPGDVVHRGDIIAEVETDKGIIEVEVFTDGVVERHLVEPGTKVPVGTPLASIRVTPPPGALTPREAELPSGAPAAPEAEAPEALATETPPSQRAPTARVATAPHTMLADPTAAARIIDRLKISPSARRRARELGVDPRGLEGTGPGGAICRDDIERAARSHTAGAETPIEPSETRPTEAAPRELAPATDFKLRMRRAIAAAMARSKREIPHYYVSTTVDVTKALEWLEEHNQRREVPDRLIPAVLFVKAVALALRRHPELNGRWDGDRSVPSDAIHVGAAIALRGGGLVAPALHHTDQAALEELMHRFRDLVGRARRGSFRSSEMRDATITVTSLGDRGTEAVFGVIYPPQVAIVGFGRVVVRPWVIDDKVVPRRVVTITLSGDHRASDGHGGALFLETVADLLHHPDQL